jgi:hypothetical protein
MAFSPFICTVFLNKFVTMSYRYVTQYQLLPQKLVNVLFLLSLICWQYQILNASKLSRCDGLH